MGQKETLISVVLEKQAEKDKAIEVYNKARELLQFYMQDNNLEKIDDGKHQFILETRHKIDYTLLRDKYPEIYVKGMTYRFDEEKAKQLFPKDVIKKALENCAERTTTYVKIQGKPPRGKANKT